MATDNAADDHLIGPREVRRLCGIEDETTGWRLMKRPEFPSPVQLPGMNGRKWWRSQVLAFIEEHTKRVPEVADA